MSNLSAMVQASRDGKVTEFETAFKSEISQRVAARIEDMKVDLGRPTGNTDSED